MFLGVDGINASGVTTHDEIEAQTNRKMVERAARVIVVCDSSKIGRSALSSICALSEIDELITDSGASAEELEAPAGAGWRWSRSDGAAPAPASSPSARIRRSTASPGSRGRRRRRARVGAARDARGQGDPRACVAAELGAEARVITPAGGGSGDLLLELLASEPLDVEHVSVAGPTRGTYTLVGARAASWSRSTSPAEH